MAGGQRETVRVICVCKSGAEYDAEWVRKLKAGVSRHLTGFTFHCLSDLDVPDRIPLRHKWPGWWSKIEVFREAQAGDLYLDLDTVVVGNLDHFAKLESDFLAIRNFHAPSMIGSAVMWFGKPQKHVYERFCEKPFKWIEYHERKRNGPYLGDQAFVWESFGRKVEQFDMDALGIKSFKFHCREGIPRGTNLICFGGQPKLPEIKAKWIVENWT